MHEINLVDPSLENYYNHTQISIQVNPDGFSFGIYSEEDNKLRAFRHYRYADIYSPQDLLDQTNGVLQKDDLLRLPHSLARIIYTERKSTLVPNDLLEKEKLKTLLEFNQPIDDLDEIHLNSLSDYKSKLVFTVHTYFAGLFSEKFKRSVFFNQATPLLVNTGKLLSGEQKTALLLQLNKEFFDIAAFSRGKLQLYNSFLYTDSNDLLYFILYVCKQLRFDTRHTLLIPVGEYAGDRQIINNLSVFAQPVDNNTPLTNPNRCTSLESLDVNRFYALLNLVHCEL
jgi:hypothetical protein